MIEPADTPTALRPTHLAALGAVLEGSVRATARGPEAPTRWLVAQRSAQPAARDARVQALDWLAANGFIAVSPRRCVTGQYTVSATAAGLLGYARPRR